MRVIWSDCPLRSRLSDNRKENDLKTWFEDKRGELHFHCASHFLQGSLRKIHDLSPSLWFSICLSSHASWQIAVCTVTHDYQHHNTDLLHVDSTTCNLHYPACATSVTDCVSHQHASATLHSMLVGLTCVCVCVCVCVCEHVGEWGLANCRQFCGTPDLLSRQLICSDSRCHTCLSCWLADWSLLFLFHFLGGNFLPLALLIKSSGNNITVKLSGYSHRKENCSCYSYSKKTNSSVTVPVSSSE